MTCPQCISKYTQASYCLKGGSTEYCCSPYDTSANCVTNSSNSVVCSPWKSVSGPLIYTYCKGAATPQQCGTDNLDLIATDNSKTVKVASLPYSVVVSNSINYLSCYYHISPQKYLYKDGAKIDIVIDTAANVSVYLLGGNSRTNASTAIVASNATATVGTKYQIDASMEAILVVNPVTNNKNTKFQFTFQMSGSQYSWWEKLIAGPNGTTYFWVAIGCAAGVAALILAVVIWLIVRCCRRSAQVQDKVADESMHSSKPLDDKNNHAKNNASNYRGGVHDPEDVTMRYNNERTNVESQQDRYGGGMPSGQGRPTIQKYNQAPLNNAGANGPNGGQDDYYANPFLPSNIQRNKQNNDSSVYANMANKNKR
eukprot:403371497